MYTKIEELKNLSTVKFLGQIHDRYLFDVPIEKVVIDGTISRVRAKDPEKLTKLAKSIEKTIRPLDFPVAFIPEDAPDCLPTLISGNQRYRVAKEAGNTMFTVQVLENVRILEDAFELAVDANFARFEGTEADVFSIIGQGYLTQQQIITKTDYADKKVERMFSVAKHRDLVRLVVDEDVSLSRMASLISSCDNDPDCETALVKTMLALKEDAVTKAQLAEFEQKSNPDVEYKRSDLERTKSKFYFKSQDWKQIENAILKKQFTEDGTLIVGEKPKFKNLFLGEQKDWLDGIAIGDNFPKYDTVKTNKLAELISKWDQFGDSVKRAYELRIESEKVIPGGEPTQPTTVRPPVQQKAEFNVVEPDDEPVDE